MSKINRILWFVYIGMFVKKRFRTVEDMENLSGKGIRPILHNGRIDGWEVQRGI